MNPPVLRHPVMITNRVLFTGPPASHGPPSIITVRMDFSPHIHVATADAPSTTTNELDAVSGPFTTDNSEDIVLTSVSSDTDGETDERLEHDKKIPKPAGEPARPGSGGYSLETVLQDWTPDFFNAVNLYVKGQADTLLDTTKSFRSQKRDAIVEICILASKRFPVVAKYERYWPIRDMLKLYLKYMAERSKALEVVPKRRGRGTEQNGN